jgi:hypothetical protein
MKFILLSFTLRKQTDSEIACEEAARLTAELQEGADSPDEDDDINYNELPPPPGKAFFNLIKFSGI